MNMFSLLSGGGSYIGIVRGYIEKVFVHEARKYKCDEADLSIILNRTRDRNIQIMVYSNITNEVLRIIPDSEVQEILTR